MFAAFLAGMDHRQMAEAAGPGLGGTAAAAVALYLGFCSSLSGNAATQQQRRRQLQRL